MAHLDFITPMLKEVSKMEDDRSQTTNVVGFMDSVAGFMSSLRPLNPGWIGFEDMFKRVRVAGGSIPPPWGSIRFRLALRTYDAPHVGPQYVW